MNWGFKKNCFAIIAIFAIFNLGNISRAIAVEKKADIKKILDNVDRLLSALNVQTRARR